MTDGPYVAHRSLLFTVPGCGGPTSTDRSCLSRWRTSSGRSEEAVGEQELVVGLQQIDHLLQRPGQLRDITALAAHSPVSLRSTDPYSCPSSPRKVYESTSRLAGVGIRNPRFSK
jgi:hypothetical protein